MGRGGAGVDDAHRKARESRERNLASRTALYQEQTAAKRAARLALQRIMEDADASPEQILRAAELLLEIGRH